jgi:transposase
MSELEFKQKTNIKFLVKLGKIGSEFIEMLVQVYGDNSMKKTSVYEWVTHFSGGRESVTDKQRSGRPGRRRTEENVAAVHQIVRENCQLPLRSMAEQAGKS